MDSKAIKLIDMILKHEGGFVNDPDDRGGFTYRGITRKNFPKWEGWEIVDANLPLKNGEILEDETLEEYVRQFYYDNFYKPLKIDDISNLLISGHLLCHGVNAGIKNSVKILQKAINKICKVSIAIDGIIGNITLSYANGDKQNDIVQELIKKRKEYYNNLAKRNPSQQKFLKGWINRVDNTTQECS